MDEQKKFKTQYGNRLKAVSAFLVVAFLSQDVAYAIGGINFNADSAKVASNPITFSNDTAIVRKFSQRSDEMVINIQDAHQKLGAQQSISSILDRLVWQYDLKLIAVEGGSGDVDTSALSSLPDEALRKKTGEHLLKEGLISAAEFYSIVSGNQVRLYGVEEDAVYRENLEVFKKLIDDKKDLRRELTLLQGALRSLEEKIYSPALKELEAKKMKHFRGQMKFAEYWEYFSSLAARLGIALDPYPNLEKISSTVVLEKNINFSAASAERESLIKRLSAELPKLSLEKLIFALLEFKQGKMASGKFYKNLVEMAEAASIEPTAYSNMSTYSRYVSLYEAIDLLAVFDEAERFESKIREALFANLEERNLWVLTHRVGIVSRLLDVTLDSADYEQIKSHKADFQIKKLKEDLFSLGVRHGFSTAGDVDFDRLEKNMPLALRFYELASQRNQILLANTLKKMRREKIQVAALVTGGFHSDGIAKLMEEEKISCLVVMPKFDEKSPDRPYISVLTKKPKEYEQLFKDSDFYLTAEVFFNHFPDYGEDRLAALVASLDRVSGKNHFTSGVVHQRDFVRRWVRGLRARTRDIQNPAVSVKKLNQALRGVSAVRREGDFYRVKVGEREFNVPLDQASREIDGSPIEITAVKAPASFLIETDSRQATAQDVSALVNQFSSKVSVWTMPGSTPRTVRVAVNREVERFERARKVRFTPQQKRSFQTVGARLCGPNLTARLRALPENQQPSIRFQPSKKPSIDVIRSPRQREVVRAQLEIAELRGGQSGGAAIMALDSKTGHVVVVFGKTKKRKRESPSVAVDAAVEKLVLKAANAGIVSLPEYDAEMSHLRWATGGESTWDNAQPHWHEEPKNVAVFGVSRQEHGGLKLGSKIMTVFNIIQHNGDLDYLKKSWLVNGIQQVVTLPFRKAREIYVRLMPRSKSRGTSDSKTIAEDVDFELTQGQVWKSVRYAYGKNFHDNSHQDLPFSEKTINDASAIATRCIEEVGLDLGDRFFNPGAVTLTDASPEAVLAVKQRVFDRFRDEKIFNKNSELEEFSDAFTKAFFYHDMAFVMRYLSFAFVGTAVVNVMSTLEPRWGVFAKTQSFSIGFNSEGVLGAAEPEAVTVPLMQDGDSTARQMFVPDGYYGTIEQDPRANNLIRLHAPLVEFDDLYQRPAPLSEGELHLFPVIGNPKIEVASGDIRQLASVENKNAIEDIPSVLKRVRESVLPGGRNRKALDHLKALITRQAQEWISDEETLIAKHAQEGRVHEAHKGGNYNLVLYGSDFNLDLIRRVADQMHGGMMDLNVAVMDSGELVELFKKKAAGREVPIGPNTIFLAVSNSGQTQAVKAAHSEIVKMQERGQLREGNNLVLTQKLFNALSSEGGQGYQLEDEVLPYTFLNLSHIRPDGSITRRNSEAASVTTAATEAVLTEMMIGAYQAVNDLAHNSAQNPQQLRPYRLAKDLTSEDFLAFREFQLAHYEQQAANRIGVDSEGQPITDSPDQKALGLEVEYRTQSVTEWIKGFMIFNLGYIALIACVLQLPLFGTALGSIFNARFDGALDAVFYLSGFWLTVVLIRWWEGRPLWDRILPRVEIFADHVGYSRIIERFNVALLANAQGFLSPLFYSANVVRDVLHRYSIRGWRGVLFYIYSPDETMGLKEAGDADSAGMVASQVRFNTFNAGGPHTHKILLQNSAYNRGMSKKSGHQDVGLSDVTDELKRKYSGKISETMQHLINRRLGDLSNYLIPEIVIGYRRAVNLSRFFNHVLDEIFLSSLVGKWPASVVRKTLVLVGFGWFHETFPIGESSGRAGILSTSHPVNSSLPGEDSARMLTRREAAQQNRKKVLSELVSAGAKEMEQSQILEEIEAEAIVIQKVAERTYQREIAEAEEVFANKVRTIEEHLTNAKALTNNPLIDDSFSPSLDARADRAREAAVAVREATMEQAGKRREAASENAILDAASPKIKALKANRHLPVPGNPDRIELSQTFDVVQADGGMDVYFPGGKRISFSLAPGGQYYQGDNSHPSVKAVRQVYKGQPMLVISGDLSSVWKEHNPEYDLVLPLVDQGSATGARLSSGAFLIKKGMLLDPTELVRPQEVIPNEVSGKAYLVKRSPDAVVAESSIRPFTSEPSAALKSVIAKRKAWFSEGALRLLGISFLSVVIWIFVDMNSRSTRKSLSTSAHENNPPAAAALEEKPLVPESSPVVPSINQVQVVAGEHLRKDLASVLEKSKSEEEKAEELKAAKEIAETELALLEQEKKQTQDELAIVFAKEQVAEEEKNSASHALEAANTQRELFIKQASLVDQEIAAMDEAQLQKGADVPVSIKSERKKLSAADLDRAARSTEEVLKFQPALSPYTKELLSNGVLHKINEKWSFKRFESPQRTTWWPLTEQHLEGVKTLEQHWRDSRQTLTDAGVNRKENGEFWVSVDGTNFKMPLLGTDLVGIYYPQNKTKGQPQLYFVQLGRAASAKITQQIATENSLARIEAEKKAQEAIESHRLLIEKKAAIDVQHLVVEQSIKSFGEEIQTADEKWLGLKNKETELQRLIHSIQIEEGREKLLQLTHEEEKSRSDADELKTQAKNLQRQLDEAQKNIQSTEKPNTSETTPPATASVSELAPLFKKALQADNFIQFRDLENKFLERLAKLKRGDKDKFSKDVLVLRQFRQWHLSVKRINEAKARAKNAAATGDLAAYRRALGQFYNHLEVLRGVEEKLPPGHHFVNFDKAANSIVSAGKVFGGRSPASQKIARQILSLAVASTASGGRLAASFSTVNNRKFNLLFLVPPGVSVQQFSRQNIDFRTSLGPAASRFSTRYAPTSVYTERFLRDKNYPVDAILDSTSSTPESTLLLLTKLAETDARTFSTLYPFVQRLLARPENISRLSWAEEALLAVWVEQTLPNPAPRRTFVSSGRLVAQPEILTNQAEQGGHSSEVLASILDQAMAHTILAETKAEKNSARIDLQTATENILQYLSPSSAEDGRLVFSGKANALALQLASTQRSRYALVDPSYRVVIPDVAGQARKTIVTELDVFAKDGAGVPWSYRMENLDRKVPGVFNHVLWVNDSSIRSLAELIRRYPQAAIFGDQVIFAPSAKTHKDIYQARGTVAIDGESIVLTSKPGMLDEGTQSVSDVRPAMVLALDAQAKSTIRFMEAGARYLLNHSALPAYVFRQPDGSLVFRLPNIVPLDYILENQRAARTAEMSA